MPRQVGSQVAKLFAHISGVKSGVGGALVEPRGNNFLIGLSAVLTP